mgnify:CR=1 FL=1
MLPVFLVLPAEPSHQELLGRLVVEGRMVGLPVVDGLDVFKAGLHLGVEGIRIPRIRSFLKLLNQLSVGAFPVVPSSAHRAGHAVRLELFLKGMTGVLPSSTVNRVSG